jgi:hypothetical protein
VEIGEFGLQQHMAMGGAGNVARTAGAGTGDIHRLVHGRHDGRMLAHAQVIVGAPNGDLARLGDSVAVKRPREPAGQALQIGENSITAFRLQMFELRAEKFVMAACHAIMLPGGRGERCTSISCSTHIGQRIVLA